VLTEEEKDTLALFGVPGVGAKLHARLVAYFGSPGEIFRASKKKLMDINGIGEIIAEAIMKFDRQQFVRGQIERMEKARAVLLIHSNSDYPPLLRIFKSAPPVLFVRGDSKSLIQSTIAFVGTRKPSDYGIRMTRFLVDGVVDAGMCVVSGMAAGIDSTAHREALDRGGKTVAVFGSGVDIIYPSFNRKLSEDIMKSGCLVSHFPMGTACLRGNFPARNAVIVGLSQATVVVEAPEKSGALITADLTLRAGRLLFTVPGNIDSRESVGTNDLIAKGAHPVTKSDAILSLLGKPVLSPHGQTPQVKGQNRPMPGGLAGDIMNAIGTGSMQVEAICTKLGKHVSDILYELTMLEMDGYVVQKPGKFFERRK
jgi:DNA processing protein